MCLLACLFISVTAEAKKVRSRKFKFVITIPENMLPMPQNPVAADSKAFMDTAAGIIFIVSSRESKFRSVSDYIDCSRLELEQQLKYDFADSTLHLISCNQSEYYPEKTNVLHFYVGMLPWGYNTYVIYFIHHRKRDIQLSFTYKNENSVSSQRYINAIMATLKLK